MSYCCKSSKAVSIVSKKWRWWVVLFSVMLFAPKVIYADQSVTLGWNASTDTSVAGYYIYHGTASGVYTDKNDVGTNTVATVSGLQAGQTNYFAVTAYNSAKMESPFSAEVSFIVPGVLQLTKSTNSNSFNIKFPVAQGHWYEVQASVDLQSWTTISQTATETSNTWIQFSDPQSNLFSKRFYRLILH
jgi:Fibronectin type III domain